MGCIGGEIRSAGVCAVVVAGVFGANDCSGCIHTPSVGGHGVGLQVYRVGANRRQGLHKPSGHGGARESAQDKHHHEDEKEAATHGVMIRLWPRRFPALFQWTV